MITMYFSDTLGLIKQYSTFRTIWKENIEMEWKNKDCYEAQLIDAFLLALYNNDSFHERYDPGTRTIRGEILDEKKYRKMKKIYKKRGDI